MKGRWEEKVSEGTIPCLTAPGVAKLEEQRVRAKKPAVLFRLEKHCGKRKRPHGRARAKNL